MMAARAAGHVPRAPLAGLAAALAAVLGCALVLAPKLADAASALLREPLEALATGDGAQALALARASSRALLGLLVQSSLFVLLTVVLASLVVQGLAFRSRARGGALRLAPLRPSRLATTLWVLGLLGSTALTLRDLVSHESSTYGELAREWALCAIALSLVALCIDSAFARARFYQSLWMTRRELLDEERSQLGAPELRAERARLTRELGGGR